MPDSCRASRHTLELRRMGSASTMPLAASSYSLCLPKAHGLRGRKRSGCQNITLAITSTEGVPCRHGHAPLMTTGTLGTDSVCSPSLHAGAGSAESDLGGHGAYLPRAGAYVAGAAPSHLAPLLPSPVECSAAVSPSTAPSGAAPSGRATGPSWPYAPPRARGRSG